MDFQEITPLTRHYPSHGKITKTAKTDVVWISNDDVVEDFDFEKLAGSDEIASDFDVRFGWRRFAARMIVSDYDCGRTRHDCQTEYFPWMTENCIHRTNGHQIVT